MLKLYLGSSMKCLWLVLAVEFIAKCQMSHSVIHKLSSYKWIKKLGTTGLINISVQNKTLQLVSPW